VFTTGVNAFKGLTDVTGATTIGQGVGIGVSLNNVVISGSYNITVATPSVSEFVALFDRFRITKFQVKIVPSINVQQTFAVPIGTAPNTGLPIMQSARDYDDINPPTLSTDLLQRSDVAIHRLDREAVFNLRPMYSIVGANDAVTGGTSAGILGRNDFLDTTTAGQNVIWQGLKLWFEALTSSPGVNQGVLVWYFDMEYEFKTPR